MHIKTPFLAMVAIFALAACDVSEQDTPAFDSAAIDARISEQTTEFLKAQPLLATSLEVDVDIAGGQYNDRLTDYSPAGFRSFRNMMSGFADETAAANSTGLSAGQAANLAIIESIQRYFAGAEGIDYGYVDSYFGHVPYMVNQISGPAIDFVNVMQTQQKIESADDARAYIARLNAFGPAFAGIYAKILSDANMGVIPPKVLVEGSISFLDGFTEPAARDNILYTAFADKLDRIDGLDADAKSTLLQEAESSIQGVVYPAYRTIAETMRSLLPKAGDDAGVWAQPDGKIFYRAAVRFMGDTDLTPDEIHDIGLAEVERITGEMDTILKANGYADGSVGERMAKLGTEERFLYPDSDAGRQQLLDDLNTQIADINRTIGDYFATIPPQKVEVHRIPIFSQDGAPGGYYNAPSLDGTRPGTYNINLRDMKAWPSFSLKTLTYHEAVPGHHFQIALNMDQKGLPLLRQIAPFNAYVEGWALYSERLAFEMGLYDDDPWGNLGRLQDELFRAVRLVVDTGLHAKRWSREQAIDYMYQVTGADMSEVVPEIERYMAWPAQALGYKLGMLKILELRASAKEALGDDFDLKEFHDVILLGGAMPMSVLEKRVNAWIAGKKR